MTQMRGVCARPQGATVIVALSKASPRTLIPSAAAVLQILIAAPAVSQTGHDSRRTHIVRDANARQLVQQRNWHKALVNKLLPGSGCFKAEYPEVQFHRVQCGTPPNIPFPPRKGPLPDSVGNGYDYSAQVSGKLLSVNGSFPVATTTGESGFTFQSPSNALPDAYTLQINSSFFGSSVCSGAANPATCQAWQQYVYSSRSSGSAFMQYWLINYGNSCPGGWSSYGADCYRNSSSSIAVPVISVTTLGQVNFTGSASKGGNDRLDLSSGATHYVVTSPDSMVNLADNWTTAEFTLVGDCCGYAANFNPGTSLAVDTTVHYGSTTAPICVLEGFTGETNNLYLQNTPPIPTQAAPTVLSDQASSNAGTASCATAAGLGDTHLHTFAPAPTPTNAPAANLSYDFQAEGDFILVLTRSRFQVQNRQVSGAPQWPNAAINKAIAASIGRKTVIFDLESGAPRVSIDGTVVSLNDGQKQVLGDDGDLRRAGNNYIARDMSGNSVQVTFQGPYIDVYVGLGKWPTDAGGLLVNAPGNITAVRSRQGKVLAQPFTLPTFYSVYGDSWRVRPSESLFAKFSRLKDPSRSNPKEAYYASNLPPRAREAAHAICVSARVKPARLADCMLDVAVVGREAVASHLDPRVLTSGRQARIGSAVHRETRQ